MSEGVGYNMHHLLMDSLSECTFLFLLCFDAWIIIQTNSTITIWTMWCIYEVAHDCYVLLGEADLW